MTSTAPLDIQQLIHTTHAWVSDFPDLHTVARRVAQQILHQHTGLELDPEHVWWHRFNLASTNAYSFTGWEHPGPPRQSMTFLELVIERFSAHDQDNLDNLQMLGGFYSEGPQAQHFDQHNEVKLLPDAACRDFWKTDFATLHATTLAEFWSRHGDNFVLLAKAHFLAEVDKAKTRKALSDADLEMLQNGLVANLTPPLKLAKLATANPASNGISLRTFDVGGVLAADTLRLVDSAGRQLLYLPGEAQSLRAFANEQALYAWLQQTLLDVTGRQQLLRHLGAFQQLEGQPLAQLNTALDQIRDDTDGSAITLLNQRAQVIAGDGFEYLRSQAQAQMQQQASALMSNAHLRRQMWTGYLGAFLNLAAAPALVSWPLALLVVGAGLGNVVLNTQEALQATDAAKRRQAIFNAIGSAVTTLFTLPFMFPLDAVDIELFPQIDIEPVVPAPSAVEPALPAPHEPVLRGVHIVEPSEQLPLRSYSIEIDSTLREVRYDLQRNAWRDQAGSAFRLDADKTAFEPVSNLAEQTPSSPEKMERALSELGIPAKVPLRIEPLTVVDEVPIPRTIHSVWIGGQMPLRQIEQVLANATQAARGSQPFETHLYLSISDASELARTLQHFTSSPSSLHIHLLEQTSFFQAFREGPFYVQYRAASSGPAANYASAVDTLRYQLLRAEGGLYMDVDDKVLSPTDTRRPFGDQPLQVKQNHLLLSGLVNHSRLGMRGAFNNSHFGSLAGNPLLDRISEESLQRYLSNQDLFHSRPFEASDTEEALTQYGRRISHVSGPEMFNAVIDRELPAFRQYRMVSRLAWGELYFEEAQLKGFLRQHIEHAPRYSTLQGKLGIGATGSWLRTR